MVQHSHSLFSTRLEHLTETLVCLDWGEPATMSCSLQLSVDSTSCYRQPHTVCTKQRFICSHIFTEDCWGAVLKVTRIDKMSKSAIMYSRYTLCYKGNTSSYFYFVTFFMHLLFTYLFIYLENKILKKIPRGQECFAIFI